MKNIIIVGGGAGGLELATELGQKLGKSQKAKITLVDRNPSHLWKPLLHEIATGVLDDNIDEVNYLAQGKRNNFSFHQGSLLGIDKENKQITVSEVKNAQGDVIFPEEKLTYDVLVMAIGSQCNDFGTPGVKENCIFLDDHIQAKHFRHNILTRLFRFSSGIDCPQTNTINIAIVGGGATGVELASELFSMADKLSDYGFAKINGKMLNVTLVEATDRILPVLPEKLSASIHQKLEEMGVKVLTKTMVTKADESGFYPKEGDKIAADMMIWAAGVKAPDFLRDIGGLENSRSNQLVVKPTLQTTRDDSIFAIGDCASCAKPEGGFTPPTAQAAHQMAKLAAKNIISYLNDASMGQFKYKDKGTIISLAHTAQGTVSTVGKSSMIVKGAPAHMIYRMLYRMHQSALYGLIKTFRLIMASRVIRSVRPTLKLD
ncbi:NAD(P)/FAD-dependent oxidoreductase [Utexia brackfieldae]|uniref:NAD(P)/FAD-dependent oxidoreductase n=1 Tax=Utexia brackfieldae TaxID=3074108 RepID=UPI00370D7FE9